MKLICVSLALLICIASAALVRKPDCEHQPAMGGCPKIYRPVCGTDMRTYSNECLLCQHIHKTRHFELQVLHEGSCTDSENKQAEDPQLLAYLKAFKKREKLHHP